MGKDKEENKVKEVEWDRKVEWGKMSLHAAQATYGARAFYFITYGFFYWSVALYPNILKDYWYDGEYYWFIGYFVMHGLSVWLLLTTAKNPGYIQPDHIKTGGSLDGDIESGPGTTSGVQELFEIKKDTERDNNSMAELLTK